MTGPVTGRAPVLAAVDLDQTLIYSRRAIAEHAGAGRTLSVETYREQPWSFMTRRAAAALEQLTAVAHVVPATTRTPEQLARVTLPGEPSRWAVAANGGVLLQDGVPDRDWELTVRGRLRTVAPLEEVLAHASDLCAPVWTSTLRTAADMFCYAVTRPEHLPPDFDDVVRTEEAWAAGKGWRLSRQGRKVYWVPDPLTKSAAVGEVARRAGAHTVLAAGDSRLDRDLVEAADASIVPRHGELARGSWTAPHVVQSLSEGVRAGEEVVLWLLERAREASQTSSVTMATTPTTTMTVRNSSGGSRRASDDPS